MVEGDEGSGVGSIWNTALIGPADGQDIECEDREKFYIFDISSREAVTPFVELGKTRCGRSNQDKVLMWPC